MAENGRLCRVSAVVYLNGCKEQDRLTTRQGGLVFELSTTAELMFKKNCKLSRREICVSNFIPLANGASQGNYFLPKMLKAFIASPSSNDV